MILGAVGFECRIGYLDIAGGPKTASMTPNITGGPSARVISDQTPSNVEIQGSSVGS